MKGYIIRYEKISDEKVRPITTIYNENLLTKEDKENAIEIEKESEIRKQNKVGKNCIRYYNPQTGEWWLEYEDRPLSPEEMEVEEVKEQFREEGREEIRKFVQEAADLNELSGDARNKLENDGVLKKES